MYAFCQEVPDHERYRDWLAAATSSYEPVGLASVVLSGFIRVATHPRVFSPPAPIERAFDFADALLSQPSAVLVGPGPRHWETYKQLCISVGAKGNLTADAFIAALAIESGCELITTDRDFSRFPGLRWRHPLEGSLGSGIACGRQSRVSVARSSAFEGEKPALDAEPGPAIGKC